MFLNRFWDWLDNMETGVVKVSIIISYSAMLILGITALFISSSLFWIITALVIWLTLTEWMFFDYVRDSKGYLLYKIYYTKLGCLLGSLGFVAAPISAWIYRNQIAAGIKFFAGSPELYPTLGIIAAVLLAVGYFKLNISIAKKIIKNNNTGKRRN